MSQAKLLLDSNVIIDYLNEREPFYHKARLIMIAGRIGDLDLFVSSSQITDLLYVLSEGGKKSLVPKTQEKLRGLCTFVNVVNVGRNEVDAMLLSSWADPEDALLYEVALNTKVDFVLSRNQQDFESSLIPVLDCDEFLTWLKATKGIDYELVET